MLQRADAVEKRTAPAPRNAAETLALLERRHAFGEMDRVSSFPAANHRADDRKIVVIHRAVIEVADVHVAARIPHRRRENLVPIAQILVPQSAAQQRVALAAVIPSEVCKTKENVGMRGEKLTLQSCLAGKPFIIGVLKRDQLALSLPHAAIARRARARFQLPEIAN